MKFAAAALGVFVLIGALGCGGDDGPAAGTTVAAPEVACKALEPNVTSSLGLTSAETGVLRGACERIPQLRQGEVTIKLVDANGAAVKGAAVQVTQTRHEFLFGGQPNEVVRGVITAEERPKFDELYLTLFNHMYLGAGFQWASYEPTRGTVRPEINAAMLQWAAQNKVKVRGGDLIYQNFFPAWFKALSDPAERLRLGLEHVADMTNRFRGRVAIWQVSNETEFRPPIGEQTDKFTFNIPIEAKVASIADYLDPAFREAKRTDSQPLLALNEARRNLDNFEVILKELKRRGTPLDVVGLHTHFKIDGRFPLDKLQSDLDRASQYGRVNLTEVSVPWRPWAPGELPFGGVAWAGWSEETQAAYIVALYTLVFGHPGVDAITYWTLAERSNDGNVTGTALLNESLVPRPAYIALKSLLKDTWWTRFESKTDGKGAVRARVFYGEYELSVTLAGGAAQKLPFSVGRDTREVTLTVAPKP